MLNAGNRCHLTKNDDKNCFTRKIFSIFAIRKNYCLGYISAFLGGAIAGAVLGLLLAPEKGKDTREKITDAVDDFLNRHNIKLSRKEVCDLVDDIQDAAPQV